MTNWTRAYARNWTEYRALPECVEVDFHWSDTGPREIPYWEAMDQVRQFAFDTIRAAHASGFRYVLMTHGQSTSRPGNTTARSVIRGLIKSKDATPFVNRRACIQHESVFVVALKPNPKPVMRCPMCSENNADARRAGRSGATGYFECRGCRAVFHWKDAGRGE